MILGQIGVGCPFRRGKLRRYLIEMTVVAGLEPATPCLQSRLGKTLNASLVSLTRKTDEIPALSNVPKLYRIPGVLTDEPVNEENGTSERFE